MLPLKLYKVSYGDKALWISADSEADAKGMFAAEVNNEASSCRVVDSELVISIPDDAGRMRTASAWANTGPGVIGSAAVTESIVGSAIHVKLWDAINAFVVASGGRADAGGGPRMDAVVAVERAIEERAVEISLCGVHKTTPSGRRYVKCTNEEHHWIPEEDTLEHKLHTRVSAWLKRTAPQMQDEDLDYATIKLTILQPSSEDDGTLHLEFKVEEESHFDTDGSGGRVPGVKRQ